jgi:hypothetical protein
MLLHTPHTSYANFHFSHWFFNKKKIQSSIWPDFPNKGEKKNNKGKKETTLAQLNPPRKVREKKKNQREKEEKGGQLASTLTLSCWQSLIFDMTGGWRHAQYTITMILLFTCYQCNTYLISLSQKLTRWALKWTCPNMLIARSSVTLRSTVKI